jgi:hypothetical protein
MAIPSSCYRICEGASLLRRLDELAALDFGDMNQSGRASALLWPLEPPILDAVRIVTCFENLFKARLLLRDYGIHRIDKQALDLPYKYLAAEQRKRPIKILEVKRAEGLRWKRQHQYVFQSLSILTLSGNTMATQAAYMTRLRLPAKLFTSLKDVVDKRNSLHYLADSTAFYNRKFVEDLLFIRESFNRFVVRIHNDLVNELTFPDVHLKKEI